MCHRFRTRAFLQEMRSALAGVWARFLWSSILCAPGSCTRELCAAFFVSLAQWPRSGLRSLSCKRSQCAQPQERIRPKTKRHTHHETNDVLLFPAFSVSLSACRENHVGPLLQGRPDAFQTLMEILGSKHRLRRLSPRGRGSGRESGGWGDGLGGGGAAAAIPGFEAGTGGGERATVGQQGDAGSGAGLREEEVPIGSRDAATPGGADGRGRRTLEGNSPPHVEQLAASEERPQPQESRSTSGAEEGGGGIDGGGAGFLTANGEVWGGRREGEPLPRVVADWRRRRRR